MINHILVVAQYIYESFLHTWPYLLITIPIAVTVKMSGASKHINRVFTARPVIAIILATFVGAFSPLCSCSVIPVVAALLIGGVPLAPVMSFWLASPSMDPEIFFLSASSLGMELAIWRLAATLVLSLGGGFITQFVVQRGWLGKKILREERSTKVRTFGGILKHTWRYVISTVRSNLVPEMAARVTVSSGAIALPYNPPLTGADTGCGCADCSNEDNDDCEVIQTNAKKYTPGARIPFLEEIGPGDLGCHHDGDQIHGPGLVLRRINQSICSRNLDNYYPWRG